MTPHRSLAVLALAAVVIAGCGGGGGGSASSPATYATSTPAGSSGGGGNGPTTVTTLAASGNVLTATESAASGDAVAIAQIPTTPTQPGTGGTFIQYAANVTVGAGAATSASARAVLAARIAENRTADAADRLREVSPATFDIAHLLPATRGARRAARETLGARRPRYTVGQTRTFAIITQNIGNSGGCTNGTTSGAYICNTTITATLEAQGQHGRIWVDNASLADPQEFTRPGEFQTTAANFDAYYAYETQNFAPAFYPNGQPVVYSYSASAGQCDANGTPLPQSQWQATDVTGADGGLVDVVITDALAGSGEGGYFYAANEFPQQFWNCGKAPRAVSNGASMFVMGGNNYTTGPNLAKYNEDYWLQTDMPRTLSHELQHLIHFHYKVLRIDATNGNVANQVVDNAFIDEGCSMLAEDLAANGLAIDTPRYSYSYLLEPSLFSLTAFTGYQPNPTSTATAAPYGFYSNTPGSYGQAYLMMRYLYDRFGGSAAVQAVYNSPATGVGPELAAAGGESFPQLYREFALALAAQNTPAQSSVYGFSPSVVLRGAVALTSRRTAPLNVRHLVFSGPQPPETFVNAIPTPGAALSPAAALTTFVVDGGTLFLPMNGAATGATARISVPSAPALQGGIVQGQIPTPMPTSY